MSDIKEALDSVDANIGKFNLNLREIIEMFG